MEYALGGIGVFVEPELQVLAEYGGYDALHFRVAELLFGLSLELGVGQLDRYGGRQPLADVGALEVGVGFLEDAVLDGGEIHGPGEGGAESRLVGSALGGDDAVGVGPDVFGITVVVLEGYLDGVAVQLAFAVERHGVDGCAAAVLRSDHMGEAGVEKVGAFDVALALVGVPWGFEDYLEALVQVGGVLEMAGEVVEVVLDGAEYVGVGQKGDGCAALGGLVALAEGAGGDAALVFLVVDAAVAVDLGAEVAGERVDDGRSDAVQSAGDLVGSAAELASGVEDGHDGL